MLFYRGVQITASVRAAFPPLHEFNTQEKKADDARSMLKLLRNDLIHNIDLGDVNRQNGKNFHNVWTTGVRYHLFDILCHLFGINAGNVFAVSVANWEN